MYVELEGEYLGGESKSINWTDKKTGENKNYRYVECQLLQTVPTEKGSRLEVVYVRLPGTFNPESVKVKTKIELRGFIEHDNFNKRVYLQAVDI